VLEDMGFCVVLTTELLEIVTVHLELALASSGQNHRCVVTILLRPPHTEEGNETHLLALL
jgi:hypothetical protein